MGKSSGGTRASSASSPKGLNSFPEARRTAEDELRENADEAIKMINKIKAPAMHSYNRITLPGGYRAEIRHYAAAYGSGGILESEIYTPAGDKVGGIANHRERYGSNGMAYFGTKGQAAQEVRGSMVDWIRVRFKGAKY